MNSFDKLYENIVKEAKGETYAEVVAKLLPKGLKTEKEIMSAMSQAIRQKWDRKKSIYLMNDDDFVSDTLAAYKAIK